jgi:quercetin dioxygenase-like cupin family protein
MTTDRVLESVTGERMVIQEATPDVLRFELHSPPQQPSPPPSAHPTQEERFQVIEGRLQARIAGRTHDYGPGETFIIPPNTFHVVRNPFLEPARAQIEFVPAHGMLPFFEDLMSLTGMNPLGLARLVKRHRDAVRLAPPFAQILGFIGLFVGTRG